MSGCDEYRERLVDGKWVKVSDIKKAVAVRSRGPGLWNKPYASDALGVSPEQIPEAREALRAHGVLAEFDKEGRCIVTSEKQFHDVARAIGMKTGRDGYDQKSADGMEILSGRKLKEGRDRFKQQLRRGEIDL